MKSTISEKKLQKLISGRVYSQKEILSFYSVDASSYQIKPKLVVIPKTINDIISIVKFAKKNNLSVTTRGSGTGLVGNSLNSGIILDMKNFDSLKITDSYAVVGPGISKGLFDEKLSNKTKFFPPNPSIGPFCSIGGMIGNNASGSRTLKYGSVIDNLKEITFVDGNGRLVNLPKDKNYAEKIRTISNSIEKSKFPKVTKNSCGYRLDRIKTIEDTAKIIAGSEGTLGIIVSAKLKIKTTPKYRKLFVIEYDSEEIAAKECLWIYKLDPAAIEFVDKKTLKNIDYKFSKYTQCLLFVEFDSNIRSSEKTLKNIISGKIIKSINNEKQIQRWWKFRDSALYYSLRSIKREKRIPHVIEDAVVPLEILPKLLFTIKKINEIFKTDSIFYGHAGNGNIHVRLISDRSKIKTIEKIANHYFNQVIRLGGSITGEHGDGLARTQFVRIQYGAKNYMAFKRLKALFDPSNILNPGKIISSKNTVVSNLEKF